MKSYGLEMHGDLIIEDNVKFKTDKLYNKNGTSFINIEEINNTDFTIETLTISETLNANELKQIDFLSSCIIVFISVITTDTIIKDDNFTHYNALAISDTFNDNYNFFIPNTDSAVIKLENYTSNSVNVEIEILYKRINNE
jgi:hypothetical protein